VRDERRKQQLFRFVTETGNCMKILWVSPFFLHPTDRGGQIRTLGTLKELHKRHEIHFAALNNPANTEGPRRSVEYSSKHIAIDHVAPSRNSAGMIPQLVGSLLSPVPLAVSRYASAKLKDAIRDLIAKEKYDSIVCDFLASAPNPPDLGQCVLFQHNVETTIWQRHVEQAGSFARKQFFALQSSKMEAYERKVCRESKFVIAVSDIDAKRMKQMFGIDHVRAVPTGVDIDYFKPQPTAPAGDIVFSGSMDWLPNIDAMEHFLLETLPLIQKVRPATTVVIAGRSPDARVLKAAEGKPGVSVTGSVPDMRPYMWGAKLSIVPIRIGGGTRLKIYECMAAGLPIVSTTVGAEGLAYTAGKDILIADSPADFAAECLRLLTDEDARQAVAANALHLVESRFSWAAVTTDFENILEENRITV
jgi:glycosyltransferase involved in cell wall biosynthesis